MSSSASSNSTEIITNVVFGITATTISIVTVYQGHKVWKMWCEHARSQGNMAPDIELGLQSFQSTPTSHEAVEREENVAASAASANQVGEVRADHLPSSLQGSELQPISLTTVEAETSLGPAMVPRGRIDGNEDVQPGLTDTERQEFPPAANEYLPSQPESQT